MGIKPTLSKFILKINNNKFKYNNKSSLKNRVDYDDINLLVDSTLKRNILIQNYENDTSDKGKNTRNKLDFDRTSNKYTLKRYKTRKEKFLLDIKPVLKSDVFPTFNQLSFRQLISLIIICILLAAVLGSSASFNNEIANILSESPDDTVLEIINDTNTTVNSNRIPFFINILPADGVALNETSVMMNITVIDDDGDVLSVFWYSNFSGEWKEIGRLGPVMNGTYVKYFDCFESVIGKVFWMVEIRDELEVVQSEIRCFTRDIPFIETTNVKEKQLQNEVDERNSITKGFLDKTASILHALSSLKSKKDLTVGNFFQTNDPYVYFSAPENSFGLSDMSVLNWSFFWSFFENHSGWILERYDNDVDVWVVEEEVLDVSRVRSSDQSFEKVTLNFTASMSAFYRLTFVIDAELAEFIKIDEDNRFVLRYMVDNSEFYEVFFDWSDIVGLPEFIWEPGVDSFNGRDVFWFQITSNEMIEAGSFVSIDPTFGREGTPSFGVTLEDYMRGLYASCPTYGEADSIHVYIQRFSSDLKEVKCAIYEYVDYSSNYAGNLINETEVKSVSGTGWYTFNFSDPKPSLVADTNYYLVAWGDSDTGWLDIGNASGGSDGISRSVSYQNWPDPLESESSDSNAYYIYCTYTQTSPGITLNSPANESTNRLTKLRCSIDATDPNGDNLDVCWYNKSSGGSWLLRQKNSSVAANSTVTWDFTQASGLNTQYWWKVTVDDGTYNVSDVYQFTTKDVVPPYDFVAQAYNTTQINLSWWAGDYADRTVVRWDTDGYPTSLSDGNLSVNTTENSFSQTDLTPGTRYFFRAWSYNVTENTYATITANVSAVTMPSPPTASSLSITPNPAYTSTDVTCTYTYTNGFQGATGFVWKVDGGTVSSGSTTKSFDFARSVVNDTVNNSNQICVADLDGDGDIDIIASDTDIGEDLMWFENDGSGGTWTEHTVDGTTIAHALMVGDLDNDGDIDIIGSVVTPPNDDVFWWENDGSGGTWTEHTINNAADSVQGLFCADIDRDSDIDVIAAENGASNCIWWENDGSGSGWTEHSIDSSATGIYGVVTYDMDSDDDVDVVAAVADAADIVWYENTDGYGTDWSKNTVESSFLQARACDIADIDNDNDPDILVSGYTDGAAWFENTNGAGTSWTEHTLSSSDDGKSIVAVDMDGDGDLDVVTGDYGSNELTWYENTDGSMGSFSVHLISDDCDTYDFVVADIVGNGLLEIVAANYSGDKVELFSLVQKGSTMLSNSNFGNGDIVRCEITPQDLIGDSGSMQFVEITISNEPPTITLSNPIQNGTISSVRQPLCRVWANDSDGDSLTVYWYENDTGAGPVWFLRQTNSSVVANSTVQWTYTQASSFNTTYWFKVAVNDSTNNVTEWFVFKTSLFTPPYDFIVSTYNTTQINVSWTKGKGCDYTHIQWDTDGYPTSRADGTFGCNITGSSASISGLPVNDVIFFRAWGYNSSDNNYNSVTVNFSGVTWNTPSASGVSISPDPAYDKATLNCSYDFSNGCQGASSVVWKVNGATVSSGSTSHMFSWSQTEMNGSVDFPTDMVCFDVDYDGDEDVVVFSPGVDDIVWFENDGSGGTWSTNMVYDSATSTSGDLDVGDVNRDGVLDIIDTEDGTSDDLRWHENDGGGSWSLGDTLDSADTGGLNSPCMLDVDGDGDMDIANVEYFTNEIHLWENTNTWGKGWTEHEVNDSVIDISLDMEVGDVDGDGDIDIIAETDTADKYVLWWENDGGYVDWHDHVVSSSFSGVSELTVVDMDVDGDVDVLCGNGTAISWFENDGSGSTWIEHVVASSIGSVYGLLADDVDSDGDMDVLGALYSTNQVVWFENRTSSYATHVLNSSYTGAYDVAVLDATVDGVHDIVGCAGTADRVDYWTLSFSGYSEYSGGGFEAGDTVRCEITPVNTGGDSGSMTFDEITISGTDVDVKSPVPNGTSDVSITPTCEVWANDTNGSTLTVYWYENSTDSWVLRQTNTSVTADSVVSWVFSQATTPSTTYWFKVSLNDSVNNHTEWFTFTTEAPDASILVSPGTWDNGNLDVGTTNQTSGFYFTLSNEGNIAINIQIKANNATNGTTGAEWKLNNTGQGLNNYSVQYNKSVSWVYVATTFSSFVTDLAVGNSQTFDLKLLLAASSSWYDPLSFTVTFKSVAA